MLMDFGGVMRRLKVRLIDADRLKADLQKYLQVQEDAAREYNITDGTYVKLQRGIIFTVMEMVQAQPTKMYIGIDMGDGTDETN